MPNPLFSQVYNEKQGVTGIGIVRERMSGLGIMMYYLLFLCCKVKNDGIIFFVYYTLYNSHFDRG
jgi:hypothetical protein